MQAVQQTAKAFTQHLLAEQLEIKQLKQDGQQTHTQLHSIQEMEA